MPKREKTCADVPRGEAGKWLPGQSANPGGKPKKLREIEAMLDEDHRNVENMRVTYGKLRLASWTELDVGKNEGFTKLYLERLQGPVKEHDSADWDELVKDASDETVAWLAEAGIRRPS